MFKRKIVRMTEAEFSTMVSTMKCDAEARKDADKRVVEYCGKMHEYHEQLRIEQSENNHLVRENEQLRMLFDKEADTQVIKYNGKLYRITSMVHCQSAGEVDTLDINAICVSEVG